MTIAIWLIVIIEAVRAAQNFMQLMMARQQTRLNARATDEFIQSLKQSDREFVRNMLEAYERQDLSEVIDEIKSINNRPQREDGEL